MKRISLYIMATVAALSATAQTLTIDSCRQMALTHNKERKIAAFNLEQAEFTRKSTKALFFPDFSLAGFVGYSNGSGSLGFDASELKTQLQQYLGLAYQQKIINLSSDMYGALSQKINAIPQNVNVVDYSIDWVYSGSVMVKQPIFMGGKIVAGYKMSKLATELYKQNQRKTDTEIIEQTDQAYATLVKAKELKEVALKYQDLLAELEKNVASAVRYGKALENDHLKVQVKQNEVQLQIRKAENGIRLATMNLCHIIGMPLTSQINVEDNYPAVEDAAILAGTADITSRPEYAMLDYKAQIAKQNINVARAELLPQIALLAKYGYTNGITVNDAKLLDSWSFTGGITVSIPLFHFGERYNKMKAAKTKYEIAEMEKQNTAELMQLQLAQSGNNLDEAKLECELADKSLLQAENSMNISNKLYNAGTETLSNYLQAQAEWQKAYQTKVDAYFQQYLASISYLKAAGQLIK